MRLLHPGFWILKRWLELKPAFCEYGEVQSIRVLLNLSFSSQAVDEMLAAANGEHKRHIMEQLLHGAAGNKKEQRIRRHFREHIANTGDILGVLLLELARFFFL